MSMYGDYIKEHRGDGIVENERGFASYRFLNERQCYIIDIFVHRDYRNTK